MAELCRMTNPLTMWSSCGIYTHLPYGYGAGYQGALPDKQSRAIADRRGGAGKYFYFSENIYTVSDGVMLQVWSTRIIITTTTITMTMCMTR